MYSGGIPINPGTTAGHAPYSVQYPTMGNTIYGPAGTPTYAAGTPPFRVGVEMTETFNPVPADAVVHAGYGLMPEAATKDAAATQHGIDVPSFKSLSGCIIVLILLMTVISLATCLGRADFNFVFYLLGYLVWCLEADQVTIAPYNLSSVGDRGSFVPEPRALRNEFTASWVTSYVCSRKMYRAVQQFTFVFLAAALVDIFWLLLAHSTWLCDNSGTVPTDGIAAAARYLSPASILAAVAELTTGTKGDDTAVVVPQLAPSPSVGPTWCFTGENQQMAIVFGMHRFVLFASTVNTLLKTVAVSLSFVWLSGQKKLLNVNGRSR